MESRAIAGGLSADHQLPGVPNAKEVLLNKLIHNHSIAPPEIVTQKRLALLLIAQLLPTPYFLWVLGLGWAFLWANRKTAGWLAST